MLSFVGFPVFRPGRDARAALAGEDRLFLLQEGLEVRFRDPIDLLIDRAAGLDRGADRRVEGRRDRDANPLVARAGMQVESRMLRAGLTPAVGRAAGAVLKDQRATQQGFVSEELDRTGSCVVLRG